MLTTVAESARTLIEKYRLRAVFVAIDRLNKSIDRADWRARDFWAQVVHTIDDYQRPGELTSKGSWGLPKMPKPIVDRRKFGGGTHE